MKLSYPVAVPDTSAKVMAWCDDYNEAFYTLKKLGYEGIELLVRDPKTVDRSRLDGLLKENRLRLSSIGTSPMQKEDGLFLMDPVPEKREEAFKRLYDLIDLAACYEAPVLIGKYRGMAGTRSGCTLEDLQNIMKKAGQQAEKAGIDIFIEPQSRSSINNLNTVSECMNWIGGLECGNIKLLLDLYHMEKTERSIISSLLKAKESMGMIHMSDTDRLVPGYGMIPVKEVLSALKTMEYEGYLSMEIRQYPSAAEAAGLAAVSLKQMEVSLKE